MSAADKPAPRKLPGSLDTNRQLDRWLRINRNETVTVYPGKVEYGQGILTAFTQIVAEELDVKLARVHVARTDTSYSPDEGTTAGSRSLQEGGEALRHASAEARQLLLDKAARQLGVSLEQLTVEDGLITARSGGSVSYWQLASDDLLAREATGGVAPKSPALHTIVGASAPRLDFPGKMTGAPSYIQDLELPGMLHGRVARPPSYGARLVSVDEAGVRAMPGVRAVVRDGHFIGVVAEREDQAIRALNRLRRTTQWAEQATLPETLDPRFLLNETSKDEVVSEIRDDKTAGSGTARLQAEYTRPYIAHASLGPSCALARRDGDHYRVWTHSQGVYPLRKDLAALLGVAEDTIVVEHHEGAGCYGHNGADDAALDATLLARAVPGNAVRVQWMRDDEFAWEPYGPAMVVQMAAQLDDSGNVVDWRHDVWSNGHTARTNWQSRTRNSTLLAARHLAQPLPPPPAVNPPLPAGGAQRNAIPLYVFPNQRITNHYVERAPLRVAALRSLGAHTNVFALESFLDELALSAGADPVEFRLRHLKDARARAVIEATAALAGWKNGEKGDGTRGRGIGFARYKSQAAYAAVIVEVEIAGEVRVRRAWAAIDAGLTVNPDGIINQTEGGIIQATSWTLKEQVRYEPERVLTRGWADYPILTFSEAPVIEVKVVNRPDEMTLGAAEAVQGPTAAAIGNAVCNAIGVRLRDMPFTRERVVAALA